VRLLYNGGRKGCQGDFDTFFRPLSPNSLPRRGERANPGLYSDFGSWIPAFAGMTRWELLAMEFVFGYLDYFGIIFDSLLNSAYDIISHKVFTLEKPINP
jgi:hypothetical protein